MSMVVTVSGKQGDIGAALSADAGSHLDSFVQKYFDSGIDSNVKVSRVGSRLRLEISAYPGRGIVIQSHGEEGNRKRGL